MHTPNIDRIRKTLIHCSMVGVFLLPCLVGLGEEEKKLPELGVYYDRADGSKINLRIAERKFRLYFFDGEGGRIPPDFEVAVVRYENIARKEREGTMRLILSEDGQYLTSPRTLVPPIHYWVKVILLDKANASRKEIYGRVKLRM